MNHGNLVELGEKYLQSLKVRNLAERTIKGKGWMLDKFFDYLAQRQVSHIDGITKEIIFDYQTELYQTINIRGRPNSVWHQNNMVGVVKSFTSFLKERDYLVSDPARDIRYAKVPKPLPRSILTQPEARKIINAPNTKSVIGYRDRAILEVMYSTGIRKEEVNNLTLNDVDYRDGFLRINCGKGKKDRVVPLGRIACRYLENYIKSVRSELIRDPYNHHLFLSSRGNKLPKNTVWELVKKYAAKAKIKKNVFPHTFRHYGE